MEQLLDGIQIKYLCSDLQFLETALHCKDRLPVFMPLEAMLVFSPFILQLLYVKCRIETRSKKYFYLHSSGLSCRRQKKNIMTLGCDNFFLL